MEAAATSGATIIKAGSAYSGDWSLKKKKSNRNFMLEMQEKFRTANGFGVRQTWDEVICHFLKHFVTLGKSLNFSKRQFLICEMNRRYSANISNMPRVLQQQGRCIKSLCNPGPVRE